MSQRLVLDIASLYLLRSMSLLKPNIKSAVPIYEAHSNARDMCNYCGAAASRICTCVHNTIFELDRV